MNVFNKKKAIIWIINIAMFIVLFFISLTILYYFNGSLEMFPTEEQQGKIRDVVRLITIILIILELLLFFIRRWIIKEPDQKGG